MLTENIWTSSEKATTFIQNEPIPGKPSTFETESYFIYDNNAVYIGARMYDTDPTKILKELSLRDQVGNADNFSVFFDTYKSGLNGFLFTVTASGVQGEAIVSNNDEDANWNAVWESNFQPIQVDDFVGLRADFHPTTEGVVLSKKGMS